MVVTPVRAVRGRAPLKIALMGPSGSGKTYSSLLIARGLGPRICLIDTEGGSGSLYDDIFGPNEGYDVVEFRESFVPQALIKAIKELASTYDVIIVDSLSMFWSGPGGILDMKQAVERQTGNGWAAWGQVTPIWNQFLADIREAPVHVIATMRTKTKWVVDAAGGNKPNKVGTEPDARDGIEYEFTSTFTLDYTHTAMASKDRTGIFPTTTPFTPSIETGRQFIAWHNGGSSSAPTPSDPGDIRDIAGAAPARPVSVSDLGLSAYSEARPTSPPPPASGPSTIDW